MMIRDDYENAKLCFVEDSFAWFTTGDINAINADDWDDAPYEHNASQPYEWHERCGAPRYELFRVAFVSPYSTPASLAYSGNSAYSVEMINAGAIAWLATGQYEILHSPIHAGTTLAEFRRMIIAAGGEVYEKTTAEGGGV